MSSKKVKSATVTRGETSELYTRLKAINAAMVDKEKADNKATTLLRDTAQFMAQSADPRLPVQDEVKRLVNYAKSTLEVRKVTLSHERNIWQYLRTYLYCALKPGIEVTVERSKGRGKDRKIWDEVITAEEALTARDANAAMNAVKEACGIDTKGATKAKVKPSKVESYRNDARKVAEWVQDTHRLKMIREELKKLGYNLTLSKSSVGKKRKAAQPSVKAVAEQAVAQATV